MTKTDPYQYPHVPLEEQKKRILHVLAKGSSPVMPAALGRVVFPGRSFRTPQGYAISVQRAISELRKEEKIRLVFRESGNGAGYVLASN